MWAGSIGKNPASSPPNSGFMSGSGGKVGSSAQPYNGVAANMSSAQSMVKSPQTYNTEVAATTSPWEDFEADKGGDSPSATQIAAVSALAATLKAQEVENNGGTNPQLEGMSKDPNNPNRKDVNQTPVKSNGGEIAAMQGNVGGPPLGLKGDEPPVQTDTTLRGQKGGDECVYSDDQIRQMRFDLMNSEKELSAINNKIKIKGDECSDITRKSAQIDFNNSLRKINAVCSKTIRRENAAKSILKNMQKGTVSYNRQLDYIAELHAEYLACKRKNTIKTEYNRMFITQMYDSNEYEGDISVFDKDWNKDDELIHDCKNNKLA
mgnify:CR=1 FL=1|tara:strand:+ start:38 stop:1000 length:963 start_codon:yes stop_codon:yes gene_type:complete